MSTPTFAIRLDTSSSVKMKGGYYPVVLQVTHERKPRRIRLGMKAKKEQWDTSRYLSSVNNGRSMNKKLDEKEDLALEIYEKHFEGKRFDYAQFRVYFKKGKANKNFYKIAEEFIKSKKRANTRRFYCESLISLKKIKPTLDINQLTPKVLLEHEMQYHSSAYMRGLKAIVNYAIMSGYLDARDNPFKTAYNPTGYSFSHIKQKRKLVALSETEMQEYLALEDSSLYHDLAKFSYYTFGINLWDFLQFTDDNEVDGAINFTRSKTGVDVIVPLNAQARKIIAKYRQGNRWFPLCDFRNEEKAKKRCANLRKRINLRMKKNLKQLGVVKDASFYSMRHTSATIALKKGAPIEKISALLGHSDISITQTYLDKFERKELKSTMDLLSL